MRVLAFVLAFFAASAGARADDDDDGDGDEDGDFVPQPTFSIAISAGGHGSRIGEHAESGVGPSLELALGRGRWQYLAEGGFATASRSAWTTGALEMTIGGRMLRGGLGARWLARQFRPDSHGGIELFLLSTLGAHRYYFDDGMRLTRPELGVGFGMQGRLYKRPRLAFRLDVRVLFMPSGDESDAGTGFSTGFGVAW